MTGFLIFSIVETRPNIIFATFVAICFTKNSVPIYQGYKNSFAIFERLK